jgi:hypothetical protein
MAETEAIPPWLQEQETAGAIVVASSGLAEEKAEDTSEDEGSDSEDDEMDYPPGPICPEKCTLGGPGYTGGAAKSTVSFFVTAKDERGTRIREGGAYFVATVRPGNAARAAGADVVTASVKDNNDGTYTASYSVAARGDYEVRSQKALLLLQNSLPKQPNSICNCHNAYFIWLNDYACHVCCACALLADIPNQETERVWLVAVDTS